MKRLISLLLLVCFSFPVFASEYILAPNDELEIKIVNQKNLDTKQTIAPDGTLSLPLLGRIEAQGKTLKEFDNYLTSGLSSYIKNSQVVVYLTPRPIYVVQHDLKKNTWEVKKAELIAEAKALVGKDYVGEIRHGDTIVVEIGKKPDFWEENWYKVLTGAAVAVGIYATLHK